MARVRAENPFAGTYRPSNIGLSKEEFMKGMKGLEKKIKTPNKHLTSTSYKRGLRKALPTSESEGE